MVMSLEREERVKSRGWRRKAAEENEERMKRKGCREEEGDEEEDKNMTVLVLISGSRGRADRRH